MSDSPAATRPLQTGQHYRVRALLPLAEAEAIHAAHGDRGQKVLLRDVEARLRADGFAALSVTQDPTDPQSFLAVARYVGSLSRTPSGLEVVGAEPVEAPPGAALDSGVKLDPGLKPEEIWCVRQALANDTNIRHLYGMADCFCPQFPVVASLLAGKAACLELQAPANVRAVLADNARVTGARTALPPPTDGLVALLRSAGARWPDVEMAFGRIARELTPLERAPWRLSLTHDRSPDLAQARAALESYALSTMNAGKSLPLGIARDEAKRAACDIIRGDPESLSKAPAAVREMGRALVTELGYGVFVVDPGDLREAMPETGEEGFVSPSALQLVLATFKPVFSRVGRAEVAGARMQALRSAGASSDARQTLKARNQIERAERALERARWIDWHRRGQWQWA